MLKKIVCCGAQPTEKVKIIPAKATKTLGIFARGSIARIQVKKIRVEKAEDVVSLKLKDIKPVGNIDQ